MSDINWDNMPLSDMLYEAADQLAGDGQLFNMLLTKAKALEARVVMSDEEIGRISAKHAEGFDDGFMALGPKARCCRLIAEALEEARDKAGPKDGTRAERDGEAGAPTSPTKLVSKEIIDGCEAGCKVFYGGERRHHKDCRYYPESLSERYDKMDAALSKANLGEGMSDEYIEGIIDECFDDTQSVSVYAAARKALNHARDKGYLSRSVEEEPVGYHYTHPDGPPRGCISFDPPTTKYWCGWTCTPLYRKVDAK